MGGVQEEVAVQITGDGSDLMDTIDSAERGLLSLKNAVGGVSAALSALAVGGLSASIQKAGELETRYAEVSTLMDGTADAAEEFSGRMRRLTTEFAVNGGEAETVGGLYQVLSAGFTDTAESTTILRKSLRLARAGLADTETSIDVVTSVLNAYGQSAGEAESVTDDLMSTVRLGKTRLPELASSIGRVVPVSSELGISFDEVAASIATLTAQGQSTDEAVTAVRQAMVELMKPTKDATRLINEMGFESGRALVKAEGFGGAIQRLRERAEATDTPFSDVFNNVRAMQAVFPLAGQAADTFNENLATMQDNAGATDEAFRKMADTAEFRFQQAIQSLNSSLATTGEDLLPTVTEAAEGVTDMVQSFNRLNEASDGAVGSIGLLTTAIGGATAAATLFAGPVAGAVVGGTAAISAAFATDFASVRSIAGRTMRDVSDIITRALEHNTAKTESELNKQLSLWQQFELSLGSILDEAAVGLTNILDAIGTVSQALGTVTGTAQAIHEGRISPAEGRERLAGIGELASEFVERRSERVSRLRDRQDRRRARLRGEAIATPITGRDTEGARVWTQAGETTQSAAGEMQSAARAFRAATEQYRTSTASLATAARGGGTFQATPEMLGIDRDTAASVVGREATQGLRAPIPTTPEELRALSSRVSGELRPGDVGLTSEQFSRLLEGGSLAGRSATEPSSAAVSASTRGLVRSLSTTAGAFESAVSTFDSAVDRFANAELTVDQDGFIQIVRDTIEDERDRRNRRTDRITGHSQGP
jgi:TP901 family phage tail tape measure protein